MNVRKRSALPKNNNCCPACGIDDPGVTYKTCSEQCMRSKADSFVNTTTIGAKGHNNTHVHIRCKMCGFEFLLDVFDRERVAEWW